MKGLFQKAYGMHVGIRNSILPVHLMGMTMFYMQVFGNDIFLTKLPMKFHSRLLKEWSVLKDR